MRIVVITIFYMGLILALSVSPEAGGAESSGIEIGSRAQNLLHIPVYGFLLLLWIAGLSSIGVGQRRSLLMAFMISTLYGAIIEICQLWVPGRFASLGDLMLNLIGIILFIGLYRILKAGCIWPFNRAAGLESGG